MSKECYFNRKLFYNVNLQGIADASLKFIDINVHILSLSLIFQAINVGELMAGPRKQISWIKMGPILCGDIYIH